MAKRRPFDLKQTLEAWLSPRDREQLRWTQEYLQKNETLQDLYENSPNEDPDVPLKYPNFLQWDRSEIIYFLGVMYRYDPITIHQELERMKSAWSQRKYRMKLGQNNKQTYNFVLSKSARQMLSYLKRSSGQPFNAIIEALITEAYDQLRAPKASPAPLTSTTHEISTPGISEPPQDPGGYALDNRTAASSGLMNPLLPLRSSQPYVDARIAGQKRREQQEIEREQEQKDTQEAQNRTMHLSFEKGSAAKLQASKRQRLKRYIGHKTK